MSKAVGNCVEQCPIIKYLEGTGENRTLSLRDGCVAEEIASQPHIDATLQEKCKTNGPSKPFLGFGRLACNSDIVKSHAIAYQQQIDAFQRSSVL